MSLVNKILPVCLLVPLILCVRRYVKNLPDDTDDEGLRKLAEEYGEVQSAVIMRVSSQHNQCVVYGGHRYAAGCSLLYHG
jgi:hypothetical protein